MTADIGPSLGLLLSSGQMLSSVCVCVNCLGLAGVGFWASSEGHFSESLGPEISSWAHWPQW